MHNSKNRYFYHIFVSPGDAPGAITLNVVWMERECDAYKLPRCMCPSNCNRFWDRARYWSKIVIFSYPLSFDVPVRGGSRRNSATPFRMEKLEWLGYHMVKKFRRYLYSFRRNSLTCQTDGRTDRHRVPVYTALMHTHRVARFLAAKYGRLLSIRDVRQGQYLRLLLYYTLTRSLQLPTFYNTVICIFIIM